jgi:hypothetical protein
VDKIYAYMPRRSLMEFLTTCREDNNLPGYYVPIDKLEETITPLLQFEPDPSEQYWVVNRATLDITYLGKFESWELAQAANEKSSIKKRTPFVSLIDAAQAAELLRSARRILKEAQQSTT